MRKNKKTLVALLLIAALTIGVGYAALSRELMISSQANLTSKQNNLDVIFTGAVVTSTTATDKGVAVDAATVASASFSATTANYSITGLSKAQEEVVLTFTVKNNSADVSAYLKAVRFTKGNLYLGEGNGTPGDVDEYFEKSVVITNSRGTEWNESIATTDKFLNPGEEATVVVTVKLRKTLGVQYNLITLDGASVYLDFTNEITTP